MPSAGSVSSAPVPTAISSGGLVSSPSQPPATEVLGIQLSRTATITLAATAAVAGAALAWWALSPSEAGLSRSAFDFHRDSVPEVTDADLALLAQYTGTTDLHALRKRLVRWWRSVKRRVHVYKCIQEMMFLHSRIDKHRAYNALLYQAAKPSAATSLRVVDVGCCFGQDTRRLLLDGVPASCIWAIDLVPDYWEAAKELWGDGQAGRVSAVHTLFGDMAAVPRTPSAIDLEGQQLLGTFHFVSAMAVLHCLAKDKCERFLSRCLSMLVPGKGVLFGHCVGTNEADGVTWAAAVPQGQGLPSTDRTVQTRFLHSASSLKQTLEGLGFSDVDVTIAERSSLGLPSPTQGSSPGTEELLRAPGAPNMALLTFMAKRPAL